MVNNVTIALALVLLSITVPGCSSEPPRYAVSGTVAMEGEPAPLVIVRFHPVAPGSLTGGSGSTDTAGKFTIGETGKNIGFPAGEYKVTFSQTLVNGKPTLAGSGGKAEEKVRGEKEAVVDDYRNPETTPITAAIGSSTNIFTFNIKAKK